MRRSVLAALVVAGLVCWAWASRAAGPPVVLHPRRPLATPPVPTIDFAEFFVMGPGAPRPTVRLLSLHQQRVTVVGHMARLQRPVRGGFFLTGHPVACDESGGGRGDLPAAAVLVLPAIPADRDVTFVPGALEVTGILQVGNVDYQGEGVNVRLLVDDVKTIRFARTRQAHRAPRVSVRKGDPAVKPQAAGHGAVEHRRAR